MEQRAKLTWSIVRNIVGFLLFHSAAFGAIALVFRFEDFLVVWYLVASILLDSLLLAVLLYARSYFYLLETNESLSHVNFANKLTLFRISSLPAILLLLIASRHHAVAVFLIIYTALAFISDLLDGYVSRTTHQTTRIGQYLDSMSDYAVLLGVAIAFASFGLISDWFFALVLVRFLSQWAAMGIIFILQKGKLEPRSSFLGKASVAITMFAFAANLLILFDWFVRFEWLLFWIELAATVVLVLSLIEKALLFVADLRRALAAKQQSGVAKQG